MAGIYLHVPFCKQACTYCDFYFSTSLQNLDSFIFAIKKEALLQKNFFKHLPEKEQVINTIYFGGGTPSLLSSNQLNDIIKVIYDNYNVSKNAEITIEVNPDDCTVDKVSDWAVSPVNRISMGVQSFHDKDLVLMKRSHNSRQAIDAVKLLQQHNITNISIDLIYGVPGVSNEDWLDNLYQAFALNVNHLSCYSLTVEAKTELANMVNKGVITMNENAAATHFELLMEEATKNKFIHYEISNFCKDGFISQHNSAYWKALPYLGLGPSAHSYNGEYRQHNPKIFAYLKAIHNNSIDAQKEVLTENEKYHEYVLISLRTIWGLNPEHINSNYNNDIVIHFTKTIHKHIERNNINISNNNYILTKQGKLLADYIIQDFFI